MGKLRPKLVTREGGGGTWEGSRGGGTFDN